MIFCAVNVAVRRLGSVILVVLGMSAAAQQQNDQTIQFTNTVIGDRARTSDSFIQGAAASIFHAPAPLFGGLGEMPGGPAPVFFGGSSAQSQKFLDDNQNWTMLTPEEILGVPTSEQIMGVSDPEDAFHLSAEDRFLLRQNQPVGGTNGLPDQDSWREDDAGGGLFQKPDGSGNLRFGAPLESAGPDGAAPVSVLAGAMKDSLFGPKIFSVGNQNSRSAVSGPFGAPRPAPPPTPDQLAGMERFRELMNPPPVNNAAPVEPDTYHPVDTLDSPMRPVSEGSTIGRPFSPMGGLGRPTGVQPLPGIEGQAPAKKPAPWVQPPPWLQNPLQNPIMPQRQF